jgi:hypothetical protein
LKERDIILSSDFWRIVINFNLSSYEETISTIPTDIRLIEGQRNEFTPVSELKQAETLLDTLELKLHYFQQFLPKRDGQRGLKNFGGTVLRTLFGTALDTDVHLLHDTLNELQSTNSDIVHSLFNQVTYIKKLDTTTQVNADAIANLSSIVKNIVVQSYDKFQETARDILWLNYSLHGQSELYTATRQNWHCY